MYPGQEDLEFFGDGLVLHLAKNSDKGGEEIGPDHFLTFDKFWRTQYPYGFSEQLFQGLCFTLTPSKFPFGRHASADCEANISMLK